VSIAAYDFGEDRRCRLPQAISRGYQTVARKFKESTDGIEECMKVMRIDEAEILHQAELMKTFYADLEHNRGPPSLNDRIYDAIKDLDLFNEFVDAILGGTVPLQRDRNRLREMVSERSGGRVKPGDTLTLLEEKLNKLLQEAGQTIDKWLDEDRPWNRTSWYRTYQEKGALREIHKIRYELWKLLVQRKVELGRLYGSSTIGIIAVEMTRS